MLCHGVVKSITAGSYHTCAIATDDKVYCWGDNGSGQLGNGNTTTSHTTPAAVSVGAMPTGVVRSITTGGQHTCVKASDDKFYCWGSNGNGQLGNGSTEATNQTSPVAVLNGDMPVGIVKSIAVGFDHTCAIASDDRVYCWGQNTYNQLGNGNTVDQNIPVAVSAGAMPAGAVKSIAAGGEHTCVIASDDKVYCWGYNGSGQLGNGNKTNQTTPVAVLAGAMPAGAVRSITAGAYHTCAIASDEKVYCWGNNYYGQLGDGNTRTDQTSPVAVLNGAMPAGAVKSITDGSNYTCAIASDDKAYCWGYNDEGELGNGNTNDQDMPVAVLAGAMKEITASNMHTCAIASDDKPYCWGYNNDGRLGNGNTTNQTTPVAVSDGAMSVGTVKSIRAGFDRTCVIASDDKAYCWGYNGEGQLGNGNTTSPQTTPVAVSAGAMPAGAVKSIKVGYSHTCIIASNDKVYCWGGNYYGQLGNGSTWMPGLVLPPL